MEKIYQMSDLAIRITLPDSLEKEMELHRNRMDGIDRVLGSKLAGGSIELIISQLDAVSVELEHISSLVSRAEYIKDVAGGLAVLAIENSPYKSLPDSRYRKLLAAVMSKYQAHYTRAELTAKKLSDKIDAMRSQLSAEKSVVDKFIPS